MTIKQLRIKELNNVHNLEFNFNDSINVFIGNNGTGKSTILNALLTSVIEKDSSANPVIYYYKVNNCFDFSLSSIDILNKVFKNLSNIYSNLRIEEPPESYKYNKTIESYLAIDKYNKTVKFEQLSDGEKNIIMLINTIMVRLSLSNEENPLNEKSIVLIDDIELHLHLAWQRLIIPILLNTFPNCQFFITTHSPHIVNNIKPKNIFILKQDQNGSLSYIQPKESYGMSVDRVVELIMNDQTRPANISNDFEELFELIERKRLKEAELLINKLKKDLPTDPDILMAEMLIYKQRKEEKDDYANNKKRMDEI